MDSVADFRTQFLMKSKCYLTGMVRCDNVLCVDDSMELKAKMDGRRSVYCRKYRWLSGTFH